MRQGYVLLDAGGTQIKSAAFSDTGSRLDEIHAAPSRAREGKDTVLENLLDIIARERDVLSGNGLACGCVGMAFPGPFDYENGISHMRGLGKYDAIEGVKLEEALKSFPGDKALPADTRLFFRHDVDSFALGTARRDPACGKARVLCLCIGTGAGSAFLENGQLLKHDPRVPENGWIYCFPFHGMTVDDWISARGLERLARAAGFPPGMTGKDLYALCAEGDPRAAGVWNEFGKLIAEALRPFIASFRPGALVFGGQISKAEKFFGPAVREAFPEAAMRLVEDTTENTFYGLLAAEKETACGDTVKPDEV